MRAMIQSDFITMKNSIWQLLVVAVVIAGFLWIGSGALIAGVAAAAFMIPFMYIFSIAAYDELNGWERFRLTLPITRRQVAFGRYASILIVVLASDIIMMALAALAHLVSLCAPQAAAFALLAEGYNPVIEAGHELLISSVMVLAATLTMPFFMRFGLTKGTRVAPIAFAALVILGANLLGDADEALLQALPMLETLLAPTPAEAWLAVGMSAGVFAAVLVLYVLSALLSAKLYEQRQF